MPGQPTEEEVSGSQAATIMTSVSDSNNFHNHNYNVDVTLLEHDKAEFGLAKEQARLNEA